MRLRHVPLETVAEAQRRAKRRLPKSVYVAIMAAVEKGATLDRNVAVFDDVGFSPRVGMTAAPARDLGTTVLGERLAMPVIIAPAGVQAVWPDGDVAVARAAASMGTAMSASNFAGSPLVRIVEANPATFFQLYWSGDRDDIAGRVEHARAIGVKALIITLDATAYASRDWGSPTFPERLDLPSAFRFSPVGLSRPRWLLRFLCNGGFPDLKVPNLATTADGIPTMFEGVRRWAMTPRPTWDDVAWLRALWSGPFLVKGIFHPDDARRAVDAGASAISVSNHGGNNLDTTPAALRALPAIAQAVGGEVEVLFDGGVRRGGDVAKALALGARAVLVGRPWIFGLAADGERGVREVLEILRAGLDDTLVRLGHDSIADLSPHDLVLPRDFALSLSSNPASAVAHGGAQGTARR